MFESIQKVREKAQKCVSVSVHLWWWNQYAWVM